MRPATATAALAIALGSFGWLGEVRAAQAPAGPALNASGSILVSDLRQDVTEAGTRLVLVTAGSAAFTHFSPDPLTVVIDVPDADVARLPRRLEVGSREVDSLKVSAIARGDGRALARFEARLATATPFTVRSTAQGIELNVTRNEAPATAAVASEPKPATRPSATTRATAITDVKATEEGYRVEANGALKAEAFVLKNPHRLVIDFSDVQTPSRAALPVASVAVKAARIAQFSATPRVARLVLELASPSPYRLEPDSDGLRVVVGGVKAAEKPATAVAKVTRAGGATAPQPAALAALPAALSVQNVAPEPLILEATEAQAPAAMPAMAKPAAAAPIMATPDQAAEKKFSGHPVSFDFKDGDIIDLFRLMSEISGLNIIVNPGVSGRVSMSLKDVPWDQALDLILKTNGLGYTLDGNVVRIARLADLQREEQEMRKLKDEKELSGELISWQSRLSYLDPTALKPVVEKTVLSARGTMTPVAGSVFIVSDLPERVEAAKRLIGDLDRPVAQVEIEARIVITSRNFTRQLGVQWGFLNQQVPQFGNTTDLAFPNAVIVNGQGVPGGGLPADQGGLAPNAGVGQEGRGYMVNLPAAGFNTAIGISTGNILGSFNLDAALTALESSGRGRVISTPRITTQDKVAANIKQGVQIPYQTVSNNTVTVSYKDAGLVMNVTPQVTDAGTVFLQVAVENSSPDFGRIIGTGAAAVPPINTQAASTSVLVRDGATTVIGGIYQGQETSSKQNTPFLSQIPILGALFKNKSVQNTNNELLIFITPRIVR